MIGKKFGRWEVVKEASKSNNDKRWICRCECGTVRPVFEGNLTRGLSTGCRKHPKPIRRIYGRLAKTIPEYNIWQDLRNRCYNKNNERYEQYGGRGITVCERWNSFENFLKDMGPRPSKKHSIDRRENDGPYSPTNCRWATPLQQRNNRRDSFKWTHAGKTRSIAEWAQVVKISHGTLLHRVTQLGWSIEKALSTPPRHRHSSSLVTAR